MWRRCTEHRPDIDKWIRDDIQTRGMIQFSSAPRSQAGAAIVSVLGPGAQVTGHGRCDAVCRLPCSLQPLEPGHPRPRPRLETEADWAAARLEVEARRERERREEAARTERARNQLERGQSEAVRIARTKLLDQVCFSVFEHRCIHIQNNAGGGK